MTLEERLAYAVSRRDDCLVNGTIHDVVYWNGYIDALNAIETASASNKLNCKVEC